MMIGQSLVLIVPSSKNAVDGIRQSGLSLARDNNSNSYIECHTSQTMIFCFAESPWLHPVHSCVYKADVFFAPGQWLVHGSIPLKFAIAPQLQGYPPES